MLELSLFGKKHKILLLSVGVLAFLYFATRLINLLLLPIFTDEAIYLWWSKIALHDPSLRFISLTDGKQPSFIWLTMVSMYFIQDPLMAGRLVSVLSGFMGLCGMLFLGWYLFESKVVGGFSAFMYLISPFFLFHDRLAIYDTLTAAFIIWGIVLSIVLVRTIRLDAAFLLGVVIGGGVLTKTYAFFNILLLPFSLLMFDWKKNSTKHLLKWIVLAGMSSLMAFAGYNLLRLSPWFYIIGRKNEEFVYTISQWLSRPFAYFLPNLDGLSSWLIPYLTIPIILLVLFGLFWKKQYIHERLFLILAFLIPFLYLALFGKVLFPRFLLFMTVPLYILSAWGLTIAYRALGNMKIFIIGSILFFIYPLYFDYKIITDPAAAPLPQAEKYQYTDDWPSGYGVKEAVSYLKEQANNGPIFVGTEGTFGLFPYSIDIYFYGDHRAEIMGYWPMNEDVIYKQLQPQAGIKPTFLLFKDTQIIPKEWPLEKVLEVRRGRGDTFFRMYKVTP